MHTTLEVGDTLTGNKGVWATASPITSFTYAWLRDGVAIGGAAASTYTLVEGDVGKNISLRVTATSLGGATQAVSASVGPILSGD